MTLQLSAREKASLKNVHTRFNNAAQKVIPDCVITQHRENDGQWFLVLSLNDVPLYSYYLKPGTYFTSMFTGGIDTPREFLFDNNPEEFKSDKCIKSHKWMFDKVLAHWKESNHVCT